MSVVRGRTTWAVSENVTRPTRPVWPTASSRRRPAAVAAAMGAPAIEPEVSTAKTRSVGRTGPVWWTPSTKANRPPRSASTSDVREITRGLHDHAHGMGSLRLDARHLGGRRGAESGRSRERRGEQCQGRRAAGAAGDHAVLRSLPRRSTSTFAVVSPKNDFGSVTPCCSSLSSKPGRMPVWRIFDVTCSPPASSTNEATNRS